MARQPIDLLVVGDHLVFGLFRSNKPALARILDQRVLVGSPTERVFVLVLFLMVQLALVFEHPSDWFVGVFDPLSFELWHVAGELAVGRDGADHLRAFTHLEPLLLGD